jgi:hypothetical protein
VPAGRADCPRSQTADALGAALAGGLVLAAFVVTMAHVSGADLSMFAAVGLLGSAAVIVMSGLLIVDLSVREADAPTLALAIVVGSVAASLFLVAGCFLTGLRAGIVFVGWAVLVAGAAWRAFRRGMSVRLNRDEVVSLVLIALTVAFWCRHSAALLPTIRTTGIAPIWTDYFIHGAQIDQFGGRLATGRLSFELSGQPAALYHFASFMLPAAASSLVDLPGVALASSVLFPFGILVFLFGTYALVRTVATPAIGVLTAQALLILPDVSTYGLRNGFFGLHWFLGASPGTGYALGTAFAALAFVMFWRRSGRRECIWTAALLATAIFQIRVQVFLLFLPAFAATLIAESKAIRRHAAVVAALVGVSIVLILAVVAASAMAQHAALRLPALRTFLVTMHTGQAPSAYDGVYQSLTQRYGLAVADVAGLLALVPAVLGAFTILCPVAYALAFRRSGWQWLDTFPVWCLLGWLGLAIGAPTDSVGEISYQFHSFVLVYAATVVWTLLMLARATAGTALHRPSFRGVGVSVVAVALCVSPLGTMRDPVAPRMVWARQYYATPVEAGLLDAATFVRANAKYGDTFILIPVDPSAYLDDNAVRFAALADVPAYLSRPGIQMTKPAVRSIVEKRLTQALELTSTTDPILALNLLREMGVRFLVTQGPRSPTFDPGHSNAAFTSRYTAVYDSGRP